MPKVSIIVPNFNHGKFLAKRLESIFSQTQQDFELIFLDDASDDDSRDVFRKFSGDARIRAEFNEKNSQSPFKQWNRGFELARGEFVWIAESDDFSDDRFLQVMIDMLEKNPSATLTYCQSYIVNETGKSEAFPDWYRNMIDSDRWSKDFCSKGEYELANYLALQNTIPNASAVVFRREIVGGLPRAQEHMRLCGDWMFWSQLATRGDICFVAEPLSYWRHSHEDSQRSRTAQLALEVREGLEVFKFISDHVGLDTGAQRRALLQQIKRWARLAFEEGLDPGTHDIIYKQMLLCHPQIGSSTFRRITLPYIFYYLATPVIQIPLVVGFYGKLKRAGRRIFKKPN